MSLGLETHPKSLGDVRHDLGRLNRMFLQKQSYTPTWDASSSSPSLGNGSLSGEYWKYPFLCFATINLTFGSMTTGGTGAWTFSLPITPANGKIMLGIALVDDTSTLGPFVGAARLNDGGTTVSIYGPDTGAWDNNTPGGGMGSGDNLFVTIIYPVEM